MGSDTQSIDPALPPPTDDAPQRRKMRKVAFASMIGTLVEGYDFMIYGTAAALVFPQIFFPALGPAAGTVASLASFGVAFVVRPLGGIFFGHLGDRIGRKRALVITLVVMGVATMLVGAVPPAATIGVLAPILIIALRVIQGLAVGGEWAGATLFVTEHAPRAQRGLWAMFPQFGGALSSAVGSATFLVTGLTMSTEDFISYGWRIPFLASFLLIGIGIYTRLKIEETPVFERESQQRGVSRIPFLEAFRCQPREVLIASGVGLMVFSLVYFCGAYLPSYATGTLGLSRTFVLVAATVGGLVYAATTIVSGILSDRLGRKTVIGAANAVGIVWVLALFPLLGLESPTIFVVAVCVTFVLAGLAYGPLGAFLPEQFDTRYRYTATGLSYNISSLIGGAAGPILAATLTAALGSFAFGVFLAVVCIVATVCTFALTETKDRDLDRS